MTNVFSVDETINASIDDVWATMTDWDLAPKWMQSIESVRIDGPTATGARLAVRARGRDTNAKLDVCDPPTSLTMVSTQGNVEATYSYRLRRLGDASTEVRLDADCVTTGPVLAIFSPLLHMAIKRADAGQIEALKELVESGTPE